MALVYHLNLSSVKDGRFFSCRAEVRLAACINPRDLHMLDISWKRRQEHAGSGGDSVAGDGGV